MKLFYFRSALLSWLKEPNTDNKDRHLDSINVAIQRKCDNKV
nr:hypothetical protein [Vibrio alginolyticus]WIW80727.1 hypothetical protein [Vibrio alginolyticus]